MEQFAVPAVSSKVLEFSTLVDEMEKQAHGRRNFSVIISGAPHTFHELRGGYDGQDNYHIVQLVQDKDEMVETPDEKSIIYEVRLDQSWLLYVNDVRTYEDADELVLSLQVEHYE